MCFWNTSQRSVNVPDVPTKYVSDGCADKVSLASDGSLVSGANLLPLVLTTFFLLISHIFLHTWLGLWPVGCGSFCSETQKKKHFRGQMKHFKRLWGKQNELLSWIPCQFTSCRKFKSTSADVTMTGRWQRFHFKPVNYLLKLSFGSVWWSAY